MPRGRGDRISVYVGDRTPEEQAFWSAVEAFRYPQEHPRAGRVHWAGFVQYVARLIYDDQKRKWGSGQGNVTEQESSQLREELGKMRHQLVALERLVLSGVMAVEKPASQAANAENKLAESAAKMAEMDW